ncbi:MAG: hypothetical protein ACK5MV_13780 [Aminipila sp.]
MPQRANRSDPKGEPIPDINTDINTSNICTSADIEKFYEQLWQLYPIKKGKGSVSKSQKQKLYKIGLEELERAIHRYCAEMANNKTEKKFWKHGSTFFNTGYIDYLDSNYQEEDKPTEVEKSGYYGRREL